MAEEDELKKVIGKRVQFLLEALWDDLSTKDWSHMATSKTGGKCGGIFCLLHILVRMIYCVDQPENDIHDQAEV